MHMQSTEVCHMHFYKGRTTWVGLPMLQDIKIEHGKDFGADSAN